MKKEMRYLVPGDYMADPAVHIFNDRVYIYPSHDWESGIRENDKRQHERLSCFFHRQHYER